MSNKLNIPICQIVGYKNAGKTTFMNGLIEYYTAAGLQVGSLKHHGHGGEPQAAKDTDSQKHLEAGSLLSGVQGEQMVQLTINKKEPMKLEEILQMYTALPIDLILLEGYKQANFPKVVLLNKEEDLHLLGELSNIIAVGARNKKLLQNIDVFTIPLDEHGTYLPQAADYIKVKIT